MSVSDLEAYGITENSWTQRLAAGKLCGRVCVLGKNIVGYCFGNCESGEIEVLVVLPEHEGIGVGKTLLEDVVGSLRAQGHTVIWLGASPDPAKRAYRFYRHLGWKPSGDTDSRGDQILKLRN